LRKIFADRQKGARFKPKEEKGERKISRTPEWTQRAPVRFAAASRVVPSHNSRKRLNKDKMRLFIENDRLDI
jgi:hypothetical protein